MTRTVHCVKLGKDLPGLDKPPFPGALGQEIYDQVSEEAFDLWLPHMTTIINHYGLNPADPETRKLMRQEMRTFFFGGESHDTAELTPETVQS
jgi:Fe-S cluster biosynthesis and repair protein YggX